MIEVNNLSKNFKNFKALDNVSFTVNKGEIVGLLGENGAGKTTLLRILSGIYSLTSGSVIIDGKSIVKNQQEVKKIIGVLFGGEVGLYDRLTARENITYFAEFYKINKKEIDERINKLSKTLLMDEYIDKRVGKFSRGMKQKVAICRSMIHEPQLMFFDEPSTGLDVTSSRLIHDYIQHCKDSGKTIILSSHSMNEVEKLCDRVIIINKGKIIDEGKVGDLKLKYNDDLENLFVSLTGGN